MIMTWRSLWVYVLWEWWTWTLPLYRMFLAFDPRESISRMLSGQFPNALHVLVPDAAASPLNFHDIVLDDLHTTPEWRARRVVLGDVTSLHDAGRLLYLPPYANVSLTWRASAGHVGNRQSVQQWAVWRLSTL